MNEVLNAMKNRRSIRKFTGEQLSDEDLELILEAGTYAASAKNLQSGKIVVIQDPETKELLRTLNASVMGNPDFDPFYGAPTICVVLADTRMSTWRYDGSLIIGNMMLAASTLGVGSCWIHRAEEVFDMPEGKALLEKWGIDEFHRGVANCILGYPAVKPGPAKPRKKDYIVHV